MADVDERFEGIGTPEEPLILVVICTFRGRGMRTAAILEDPEGNEYYKYVGYAGYENVYYTNGGYNEYVKNPDLPMLGGVTSPPLFKRNRVGAYLD